MTHPSQADYTRPIDLGYGFTRQDLYDGRIVIWTNTTNVSPRELVDQWVEASIEHMQNWDTRQPRLVLCDFRQTGVSRYAIKRAEAIMQATPPDLFGRTAILIAPNPMGQMIRLTLRSLMRLLPHRNWNLQIFLDYDKALNWLIEELPE